MRNVAKKSIVISILVVAMILALFSVAFADAPQYIYYENQGNKIVRADYQQAIDDLPDDTTLRNAIRAALMDAIGAFRDVWVENKEGVVIDYSKALDDGIGFPEAITDLATYQTSKPIYDKDIIVDPIPEPDPPNDLEELTVHFIDVGQGDSILIQSSSQNVLIDGGNRGNTVVDYLTSTGVDEIDIVIGTHPHADHIGGLINVMEAIPVDEVIDPGVVHTTITYEDYIDIIDEKDITFTEGRAGISRDLGDGANLEIIHPVSPSSAELNNASIVARVTFGDISFLFTGDAEHEAETEMLNRDYTLESTILKVGHHGSRTSTTQEFLDAVDPEAAVIMCGLDNTYGHPHVEVLDRLSAANVDIYRTDLHGDVVITTDGKTYTINTYPYEHEDYTKAGGIINQDTNWTLEKSPYVLIDNVQIDRDVTLSIEPGVLIKGNGKEIQTFGNLEAIGTSTNLVRFKDVHLTPGSRTFEDQFFINIQYAEILSGSIYKPGNVGYGSIILRDSTIKNCESYLYLWYPKEDCYIERNVFINSGGISTGTSEDIKVYISNNVFLEQHTDYAVENWASYDESETIVEYNSFLSTDRVAVRLPAGYPSCKLTAKNNFWNTTDLDVIESMIRDRNDDLNIIDYIEYIPFLDKPHHNTPLFDHNEEELEEIPITAIAPIIGEAKVGSMLEAGALTPADATAVFQWKIADEADGLYENIAGATSSSYSPVESDEGYYIKVEATGTGDYTGTVTSVSVGPIVKPAPDPPSPGMVNINTASHQELQRIIHIGPVRASEIISLRPFSSVNALTRVSGIGPARLQDIINQGIAYVD